MIVNQLPILLFISLDGFMPNYLDPKLTPNLYELSKSATMGNMISMFATKTFPNHFSMVTGLYEDEHQVINNRMFDPRLNERFRPSDNSEDWWNFSRENMPIWIANQLVAGQLKQTRYSGSMMYPGASTHYAGMLPTHLEEFKPKADYVENVEKVISWITHTKEPANFVSVYFDQPDSVAHQHGPWGEKTLEAVSRVDSAVGLLVQRLKENGLDKRTNLIIVSDHGMAEVKHVFYLKDLPVDTSKFTIHGNSPNWSVFVTDPKDQEEVFRQLEKASLEFNFKICKRADIPPEYHYSKSDRVGDFLITVDEHNDMFREPNPKFQHTAEATKSWGNHGWDPATPDMRPFFMVHGPAFKQGYYHDSVFPNIDLFPLMVYLLALPQDKLPSNGSLDHIIDVVDPDYARQYQLNEIANGNYLSQALTSSANQQHSTMNKLSIGDLILAIIVLVNVSLGKPSSNRLYQ